MDWTLISWYQGTDDSADPSMAIIQVMYLGQAICYETACDVPVAFAENDDNWTAYLESIAQSVLACCPATIANPNYDPTLTGCWA